MKNKKALLGTSAVVAVAAIMVFFGTAASAHMRLGKHSSPISCSSAPVGNGSAPIGESSPPVSSANPPVSQSSAPVSQSSAPVGESSGPVSEHSAPKKCKKHKKHKRHHHDEGRENEYRPVTSAPEKQVEFVNR